MLTMVIGILMCIVFVFIGMAIGGDRRGLLGGLVGCVLGMAVVLGSFSIAQCGQPKYREFTRRDLVAFSGDTVTKGFFLLASGPIGEEDLYRYLYQRKDGAIKQGRVNVDDACIFEDDESPVLAIHEQARMSRYFYLAADGNPWPWYRYEFHIPAGSIMREFELDIGKQ